MAIFTVRISDEVLQDTSNISNKLNISRNAYVSKAIKHMNDRVQSNIENKHMINASMRVRNNSMKINREFARIENDEE